MPRKRNVSQTMPAVSQTFPVFDGGMPVFTDAMARSDTDLQTADQAVEQSFHFSFSTINDIDCGLMAKRLLSRRADSPAETIRLLKTDRLDVPLAAKIESGYLTPLEKEIAENIKKFRDDGQITDNEEIYFTASQLYRAMRHGAAQDRPANDQLIALAKVLYTMKRKIKWEFLYQSSKDLAYHSLGYNAPLLDFTTASHAFHDTPTTVFLVTASSQIIFLSTLFGAYEYVPQRIKAVCVGKYGVKYAVGDRTRTKSFITKTAQQKFLRKHPGTTDRPSTTTDLLAPFILSDNRLALRQALYTALYSRIRIKRSSKKYVPRISYTEIWNYWHHDEATSQDYINARRSLASILNHLLSCGVLIMWEEYTDPRSGKPAGIRIQLPSEQPGYKEYVAVNGVANDDFLLDGTTDIEKKEAPMAFQEKTADSIRMFPQPAALPGKVGEVPDLSMFGY